MLFLEVLWIRIISPNTFSIIKIYKSDGIFSSKLYDGGHAYSNGSHKKNPAILIASEIWIIIESGRIHSAL